MARRRRLLTAIPGPNKIAFSIVPKVATSSVKAAILISKGYTRERDMRNVHHHPGLDRMDVEDALRDDWRVFALVRDPLTRLISAWSDKVMELAGPPGQGGVNLRRVTGARVGEDFGTFLGRLDASAIHRDVHLVPQVVWAPHGVVVGRFEDLPQSWRVVQEHWRGLPDLPFRNVSRLPELGVSEEARAKVRELYAIDYEAFGY